MENEVLIRPETPGEYTQISELIKEAFATALRSDGDEQEFAEKLRARPGYLPELALVAVQNGQLVGHIMLTEIMVALQDGGQYLALMLAPLAVKPGCQKQGIGQKLTRESLRLAKEMGYKAVFLAGHAQYYPRFGFVPSWKFGIEYAKPIPSEDRDCIMALELEKGALAGIKGTVLLE